MFKNLIIAVMTLSICFIVSCTSKDSFITDDKGHKQYKDSLGNFVKDDWVEINGDKYFFDMNGFLVTNKWVRNEYYVDEKGRMTYDYWFEDENGNQ